MQGDKIGKQSASVVTTITFGSVRFTQGGACAIGSLSTGNISPQDPNMIKYVTDPSVVIPAKPIAL